MSLDEIKSQFGPEGITDYYPAFGKTGAITDDTQMTLSVNHGGDSDSTGSITGNILGALLGVSAIPKRYLDAQGQKEM